MALRHGSTQDVKVDVLGDTLSGLSSGTGLVAGREVCAAMAKTQ
jgi:hypothetical protein